MRTWLAVAMLVMKASAGERVDETPQARLTAIEAAQRAARVQLSESYRAVERTEEAQKPALDRFLVEHERNMTAALALAREYPADPVAFAALRFVVRENGRGPGPDSARALAMMLERGDAVRPGQGSYLAVVALLLFQYPDAETLLRRVLADNPHRDDRAAACYWLARHLQEQARMVRKLRGNPEEMKMYERYTAAAPIARFVREKDPDTLEHEALALLKRAVAEFGNVRLEGARRGLGDQVSGELFALRSLNVGQHAPEISGADHEGKRFTLGEFRGKVVVLTFSGNWCGPCVGMYPQERELVARYKDRPFALVSVSTDSEVKTLGDAIRKGEITWRCWWDGGTDGPITTRWGVTFFPSIFVLDRDGVIRFKGLRGDELERAVASLLDERP
jgi:peroxiredoxin